MPRCRPEDLKGGDAAVNCAAMRAVFERRDRGPHRDALSLQCGLALYIAGRAVSIGAGIEAARETLDSGRAADWLARLTAAAPVGSGLPRQCIAGVLDWVALAVVVAAVSGISDIHGWEAWLLGPFAATVLYLLAASAQLAVLAIHRGRHRGDGPATGRDWDTHRAAR